MSNSYLLSRDFPIETFIQTTFGGRNEIISFEKSVRSHIFYI